MKSRSVCVNLGDMGSYILEGHSVNLDELKDAYQQYYDSAKMKQTEIVI